MFPEVYLFPKVDDVSTVAPGTPRLAIGQDSLTGDLAAKVLKDCASLANNGWSVYVAKLLDGNPPAIEYGLFRSLRHAFATSAEESMTDGTCALIIRNRGHLIVEFKNAANDTLTISFTSAPAGESQFARDVADFVSATCATMVPDRSERFQPYLTRMLIDTLQHCHGTLLAALKTPLGGQCPDQFGTGIWLQTPLSLAEAHDQATTAKDAEGLAQLQSLEALIAGMIRSDGVVVFGTDGTVLGYRIFLSPTDEEKRFQEQEGGGRRRTYSLMKLRLGGDFEAAFYRSQDGATACERKQP